MSTTLHLRGVAAGLALSAGQLVGGPALAATCVAYPSGATTLQIAGQLVALPVAKEIDPCVGLVRQGGVVIVMRGADGLTKTREFREGATFDASTLGVARPGKLITAVLTGTFVSRPGSSRGPVAHPEAFGIPVGDILLPTQALVVGPSQALQATGFSELVVFDQANDTPLLTLALTTAPPAQIPAGLFNPGGRYSWTLLGAGGTQSGVFQVLSAQRQQAIIASLTAAGNSGLAAQLNHIGLLIDQELTFDAVQRQASLPR